MPLSAECSRALAMEAPPHLRHPRSRPGSRRSSRQRTEPGSPFYKADSITPFSCSPSPTSLTTRSMPHADHHRSSTSDILSSPHLNLAARPVSRRHLASSSVASTTAGVSTPHPSSLAASLPNSYPTLMYALAVEFGFAPPSRSYNCCMRSSTNGRFIRVLCPHLAGLSLP